MRVVMQVGIFWPDGWHPIHVEECDSETDGRRWLERRGDLDAPLRRDMIMVMCEANGTALGGRVIQVAKVPVESRQSVVAILSEEGLYEYQTSGKRRRSNMDDFEFGLPATGEWTDRGYPSLYIGSPWTMAYIGLQNPEKLAENWFAIFGHRRYVQLMLDLVRDQLEDHLQRHVVESMLSLVSSWLDGTVTRQAMEADVTDTVEALRHPLAHKIAWWDADWTAANLALTCLTPKSGSSVMYGLRAFARTMGDPDGSRLARAMHRHVPVAMAAFAQFEMMARPEQD